MEGANLLHI